MRAEGGWLARLASAATNNNYSLKLRIEL